MWFESHTRYELDSLCIISWTSESHPLFCCCCKDGHATEQITCIGTKTWQIRISVWSNFEYM